MAAQSELATERGTHQTWNDAANADFLCGTKVAATGKAHTHVPNINTPTRLAWAPSTRPQPRFRNYQITTRSASPGEPATGSASRSCEGSERKTDQTTHGSFFDCRPCVAVALQAPAHCAHSMIWEWDSCFTHVFEQPEAAAIRRARPVEAMP